MQGRKQIMKQMKKMSKVFTKVRVHRTFGGDLPKIVRETLQLDEIERLKGKDIGITMTFDFEVYD